MDADKDDKNGKPPKDGGKEDRKKLERFLSSLCQQGGLSGKPAGDPAAGPALVCRGPCRKAQWRAHLDIPGGILCVSAAPSTSENTHPHRDVTIGITYWDEDNKPGYTDITFCDSEVRWIMESLWHAPIWE